jgi:polysaccharide export outer membrane protein
MVQTVMGKISKTTARRLHTCVTGLVLGSLIFTSAVFAQATGTGTAPAAKKAEADRAGVEVPPEYVIGPEDILGINFWREAEMTGDVTVRPDGRVTLPLLGDIEAAGLSPTQLADRILQAAKKLIADPTVTVVVRTINSRKVYITGQVANPGAYPLTGPRTVMQTIALAGGLTEYADKKNITINRTEQGKAVALKFNYNDVARGKNLSQNIVLKPGDTVVVP